MAVVDKPAAVSPRFNTNTLAEWIRTASTAVNWMLRRDTLPACTVAQLPAASDVDVGQRGTVTNANATTFASVVAGGGSNTVPVYSDGSDWRIG